MSYVTNRDRVHYGEIIEPNRGQTTVSIPRGGVGVLTGALAPLEFWGRRRLVEAFDKYVRAETELLKDLQEHGVAVENFERQRARLAPENLHYIRQTET